jgi:hypothetical protein
VKLDAPDAADASEREAVLMLQASEFALDRRALAIEVAPPLAAAVDALGWVDAALA